MRGEGGGGGEGGKGRGGVRGEEGKGGKEEKRRREKRSRKIKISKEYSSILVNFYVAEVTQLVHTAHKIILSTEKVVLLKYGRLSLLC